MRLWKHVAHRLVLVIPVLWGICTVTFVLIHLIPGNIVTVLLGPNTRPEVVAALTHQFGLDRPLPVQYTRWLASVATGHLGNSLSNGQPVVSLIARSFDVTGELALLALSLAVAVAVPLGVLAAARRNTATDYLVSSAAVAGLALPDFWLGTLLVLVLSLQLRWLPPSGFVAFSVDPGRNLELMLMPVISLAAPSAAYLMRMTRGAMIEVVRDDYVRTARAKGLPSSHVLFRHALRNAIGQVLTVVGMQAGYLLGGAIIIETIFSLPGVGQMAVGAITGRDYPVVLGSTMTIATVFVLANLLVDIVLALIDPRIREA